MEAGFYKDNDGVSVFDPFLFHKQIQDGLIKVSDTSHKSISQVTDIDQSIWYIFWDEVGLASPAGDTFEKAEQALAAYCSQL